MVDTKKLGAELGEKFAKDRLEGTSQQREAKALIEQIVARDPKIKLPTILNDATVKDWQDKTGVADGHLKDALTKARAELRQKVDPEPIRIPPRRRKREAASSVDKASERAGVVNDNPSHTPGMIPNQSLDLL